MAVADQADKLRLLAAEMRDKAVAIPQQSIRPQVPAHEAYHAAPKARVIAVASGKGGVGKTNMAVNLSLALGKLGRQVILFDADLGLANADLLLGIQPRFNLTHFFQGGRSLTEIMCEGPYGLKLIPSGNGIAQLADLGPQERERVLGHFALIEDQADYLVVDTGAGISRNVVSFAQAAEEVLVVTTPEPPARLDAYGLIKVLAQDGYAGRLRVIVNMAESMAEGEEVGRLMENLAGRFLNQSVELLGVVPRDKDVPKAVRAQKPFLLAHPQGAASQAVMRMATAISQVHLAVEPRGIKGFLERLGVALRPKG